MRDSAITSFESIPNLVRILTSSSATDSIVEESGAAVAGLLPLMTPTGFQAAENDAPQLAHAHVGPPWTALSRLVIDSSSLGCLIQASEHDLVSRRLLFHLQSVKRRAPDMGEPHHGYSRDIEIAIYIDIPVGLQF